MVTTAPHRSIPTRLRDRARAFRHAVDLRAQIAEHPWHAIVAGLLVGAWLGFDADRPAPAGPPRLAQRVRDLLVDGALMLARDAIARQVSARVPAR